MPPKRKRLLGITPNQVNANVRDNKIRAFVLKKFKQIDIASWPEPIKSNVKKLIYLAACDEARAVQLAQPKYRLPHAFLVETYSNTLFKEFNRFLASRNVEEFIAKRGLALPRVGRQWYGTKKDTVKKIMKILDSNPRIQAEKRADVIKYLGKNQKRLTSVQLHRVQHYAVGLAIEAM